MMNKTKKILLAAALLGLVLLCCACGGKGPGSAASPDAGDKQDQTNAAPSREDGGTQEPAAPDLSGVYTDRQGTPDVYSELELKKREDGTYGFSMGIYRVTTLEGTASVQDGVLHFVCGEPAVEGDISVSGQEAEVTITASDFAYIAVGDVYRFPDGPVGGQTAPSPAPAPAEGEPSPAVNDRGAMLSAYYGVLRGILYDHVFPDGTDCGYYEAKEAYANQFAICDVDGDGEEELIVLYTTTPAEAGKVEKIYRFDHEAGEVREVFSQFPLLTFYDNGVIQAGWAHRPGPGGDDLWPYTLWQHDPATDGYTAVGMVEAWDRSWSGDEYNGQTFPDDVDQDGDGVVYYIMDYGNYDLSDPVDNAAYEQWRSAFLDGAEAFTPPFQDLSAETIE